MLKPDQLVLVLFLTNQTQKDLSNVGITIETPSNMKAATPSGGKDLSATVNIGGFGSVCCACVCVYVRACVRACVRVRVHVRVCELGVWARCKYVRKGAREER